MPLYRYKALNSRGEMLDGQMEAASDGEVALRLQEQGHLPVEAKLASDGGGESIGSDVDFFAPNGASAVSGGGLTGAANGSALESTRSKSSLKD